MKNFQGRKMGFNRPGWTGSEKAIQSVVAEIFSSTSKKEDRMGVSGEKQRPMLIKNLNTFESNQKDRTTHGFFFPFFVKYFF